MSADPPSDSFRSHTTIEWRTEVFVQSEGYQLEPRAESNTWPRHRPNGYALQSIIATTNRKQEGIQSLWTIQRTHAAASSDEWTRRRGKRWAYV